jgi:hypothetical protein
MVPVSGNTRVFFKNGYQKKACPHLRVDGKTSIL